MGTAALETFATILTPGDQHESVRNHSGVDSAILFLLFEFFERFIGMTSNLVLRHRRCRLRRFAGTTFHSQQQQPYSSRDHPMLPLHPPYRFLQHTHPPFVMIVMRFELYHITLRLNTIPSSSR